MFLPQTDYLYAPGPQAATLTAEDGTGYTAVLTGIDQNYNLEYSIYDKAGNSYPFYPPAKTAGGPGPLLIQDPDETQITWATVASGSTSTTTYADTLGATAMTTTATILSSGLLGVPFKYQYADAVGNTQSFQINYSTYTLQTAFGCLNAYNQNIPHDIAATPVSLPSSLTTPTTTINFSYEPTPGYPSSVTGRLAKITYGSGGSVSYAYSGGKNGISCTTYSVPTVTRTVNDNNGNVGTWTYVNSGAYPSGFGTVTETDPAGNQTVYSFAGEYQTQAKYYQGSATGAPLKTVTTCYNANFTSCAAPTAVPTLPFSQTDVFTSFNGSSSNLVETKFDSYGNTTEVKQYDFGAAMPPTGSPLSDTLTYYGQSWNGTSCTAYPSGTYIRNTPCYSYTKNAAGIEVAATQIAYSNTGHPTSTAKWTESSWLTSTATYNSNGTVATATDVNGALSTYAYNGTDGCNSLLATSVTLGGLTNSTEWNCNGATVTSTLDPNGQPTTFTYNDPLWRVTSMTDPLGNVTNYSYPTTTTSETVMNFGTTSTSDILVTTDGLGRQILSQRRQAQGSSNFDSTQTTYNWTSGVGAFTTVSMPYVGTAGQKAGAVVTKTQYDTLSRPLTVTDGGGGTTSNQYVKNDVLQSVGPTQTFQKQLEFDGLGRLTSVCEITSASGSGACGQSNSATGFLTKYIYDAFGNLLTVTQNAQPGAIGSTQTRSYTFDGLSRMTSETNPESGTKTYVWDVNYPPLGCGTGTAGDISAIGLADGRGICFSHDALHRITAANTTDLLCRYFVYDSATVDGQAMANAKGRLAEAWTAQGSSCSSALTVEGFSYSNRGEPTDLYASTPHSGGSYHSTTSYWANGGLESLGLLNSAGAALMPRQTYGVEGEGRTSSVTASSGQSPASSVTYTTSGTAEPIGSITNILFGSQDSDGYQYDPNTGRMTQYSLNVNGQSAVGKLTWNANGTLQQLAITDPFNSQDNQTCNSTYDDLARINGNNCGSVWAQTFNYDAFGNVTKSGSISWQPGYNASTNHYALGGTSYDANGSLLTDTFNTYTWDAYGDLASANGAAITYDAFGRMVENHGGTDQYVYSPGGQQPLAETQGQSLNVGYIPLPGGAFAIYKSSGLFQYNHGDWLGSARLFSTPSRTATPGMAYAPFGEGYAGNAWVQFTSAGNSWTVDDGENQTGSLEDFMFRRYSPTQSRWISPDPAGLAAVDPTNPQSWNRYVYALNNPLRFIDPSGLVLCDYGPSDNGGEDFEDAGNAKECTSNGGTLPNDQTTVTVNGDAPNVPTATFENGEQIFPQIVAPNNGRFLNWLTQKVKSFCSAYPDVGQIGAGADWGFLATGGAQVTLNANGNSGQLSLSWAWNINAGFAGPDAYVLGGVVRNAPTNASLEGLSFSGNLAVGKTGLSGNSNNIQATLGPSALPATVSGTTSANLNFVTIPYAGYLMNDIKGSCTALFGKHD